MTNADKYNLTKEQARELCYEIARFCNGTVQQGMIQDFFNCPLQPTLTEDERVILKQVSKAYVKFGKNGFGQFIFRIDNGEPFLLNNTAEKIFDGLFQFIKNGEEYEISELLKGE